MATAMDHFVALSRETTFGVQVVTSRCYPFMDGTDGQWDPRIRQGMGVQGGAGRRTVLGSRAFAGPGQGEVTVLAELESKAGGVLFDLAFGVSTVTPITGGAMQQHHTGVANMVLPSATVQIGKVRNDGTYFVETFRGCTAKKVKITQDEDAVATIEVVFDALGYTTATAAIAPTYALTPTLFASEHVTVGYGGTLTAPTTSAFASGLTAVTNWRKFEFELEHTTSDDGWVLNGGVRSQPRVGMPTGKLTGEVEFNDTVIPANYTTGVKAPWYATWLTGEVVTAGVFAGAQLVLPQIMFTKGIPTVKPGEAPTTFPVEAELKNDGTNRDLWWMYRSTDTVL